MLIQYGANFYFAGSRRKVSRFVTVIIFMNKLIVTLHDLKFVRHFYSYFQM